MLFRSKGVFPGQLDHGLVGFRPGVAKHHIGHSGAETQLLGHLGMSPAHRARPALRRWRSPFCPTYYTGSYTANYEDFSDTEYLFGGTSIKREAGKDLSIDCALAVTDGTAKVFWISEADEEVTLLETTGTYSDTITLPEG